jgi:hypothetical protein
LKDDNHGRLRLNLLLHVEEFGLVLEGLLLSAMGAQVRGLDGWGAAAAHLGKSRGLRCAGGLNGFVAHQKKLLRGR